ncbi:YggT family protein [Myxococcota bacterium]|nr:YggT family protein [Myxococcota bacterium]
MTGVLVLALELAMLLVVVDLLVGWVQPETDRWPRRPLHALTEPVLRPLRRVSQARGWDWSPLVLILLLGALRVALDRA